MKFPQESALITRNIKTLFLDCDYQAVCQYKNQLFDNFEMVKKFKVFEMLVISAFNLGYYDEVILIGEELLKREYESNEELYYVLLSCLANDDIFHGLSLIKRSRIINNPLNEQYLSSDGANYSYLLQLPDKDNSFVLLFLIVLLIKAIGKEYNMGLNVDKRYIFDRFVEEVDLLYEMGYDKNIIDKLSEAIEKIYILPIENN